MGKPKIPQDIIDVKGSVGNLNELETVNKSSLVKAINEVRNSGGGSGRGVFMSGLEQGSFTATADTTTFTISTMKESKIEELIFENYQLVVGQNYEINKSTGVVTLSFTLKANETIYYRLFDSSYSYNDLSDKLIVEDNLTTTAKGRVLDASQGKILNDKVTPKADKTYVDAQDTTLDNKITVLSNDKANKNTVVLKGTPSVLNEFVGDERITTRKNTGKALATQSVNDIQAWFESTDGSPVAIAFMQQGVGGRQLILDKSNMYLSNYDGSNPKQLATTEKVEITLRNGWTETYPTWNGTTINVTGNVVYGSVLIKNASQTNTFTTIADNFTLPFDVPKSIPCIATSETTGNKYICAINKNLLSSGGVAIPSGSYVITF